MSGRIKSAEELPPGRDRARPAIRNGKATAWQMQPKQMHGKNGAREETSRVAKLERPTTPVSFGEWRDVIGQSFPALVKAAEICASVVAQLLLNDVTNPFALALVDAPSSGKTITLNFFDVPELIYSTDYFSPASFVSQASNVQRDELGKIDLLPRIRWKAMVMRDLATIFGAKEDELLKIMGLLTRALDGEGLELDSGTHGQRGYSGDYLFMLLAGTTPIPPRVFNVMGGLGCRLFCLALNSPAKNEYELMAQNRGSTCQQKIARCKQATRGLLQTLWAANNHGVTWNTQADSDDRLLVIARCAKLLAPLRGVIHTWKEPDETIEYGPPTIEKPDRINSLLYNLARGHALICGRTQLTIADMWPVLEVAFDSAPPIRGKLFRGLIRAGGSLRTRDVMKVLRCGEKKAGLEMEKLALLGVAEISPAFGGKPGRPQNEITLHDDFAWFRSSECHDQLELLPAN